MIDNLGGRLGSFDRLERELPDGESWSRFDRALSGSAFFGSPRAKPPERPAAPQNAGFQRFRRGVRRVAVTILGSWQRTPRS